MHVHHRSTDIVQSEPYWWTGAPRQARLEAASLPADADVVVIGSGYAGASAARTLAAEGRDVVVIERDRIGEGASTRNGGAVGETLRVSYSAMKRKFGASVAGRYYAGVREARSFIDDLIERERIDCSYRQCGRVMCAHTEADYETLARDLEERRRDMGFEADMVPRHEIHRVVGSDAFAGARVIHTDGNLQPARFHDGLVGAARAAGARVVEGVEARGLEQNDDGRLTVRTARGDVAARDVVVATNGYTSRRFPWLARRIIPIQSQIIATEPLSPETLERLLPRNRQMGDTRKLHNYWRIAPDGERILYGGRAGAAETRSREKSVRKLRAQMLLTYPELETAEITHAWAGYIAYTFDSLPHIGRHRGVHYIGGCCGSGVAMQPYLGHQTALNVLGRSKNGCSFDVGYRTVPGYSGKPWFIPPIIGVLGMLDRMKGRRSRP